jgi:hypothetical protein
LKLSNNCFDVTLLIQICSDISITKKTFEKIAKEEILFRNLSIQPENIFEDIFQTALTLAKRDKNIYEPEKSQFLELQRGIKNIVNFLIKKNLKIEQAIASSAKIAWFTELMKQSGQSDFILYSIENDIDNLEIQNTNYNFLNRLKKTNKEAFYYWYNCLKLRNELI